MSLVLGYIIVWYKLVIKIIPIYIQFSSHSDSVMGHFGQNFIFLSPPHWGTLPFGSGAELINYVQSWNVLKEIINYWKIIPKLWLLSVLCVRESKTFLLFYQFQYFPLQTNPRCFKFRRLNFHTPLLKTLPHFLELNSWLIMLENKFYIWK